MGNRYWYQKPMRILQTVLREIDADGYDPQSVVSYMERGHYNVLVVNAGGIFDFFQNTLPTSNIVTQMGKRDILREITEACHEKGYYVIARVDFRGVKREVYERCPSDWFAKDENGNTRRCAVTSMELFAPCYNSYYRNEYAAEFLDTLMRDYNLDGIWHNALLIDGICYCDRCREEYRKATGRELPIEGDPAFTEEDFDAYWAWKADCASRNMELLRSVVKKYGEDKTYSAEVFNMFSVERPKKTGVNLYSAADHFDYLVDVAFLTENAKFVTLEDFEYAEILVRFLRNLDRSKQPVILYGTNGTSHRLVKDPVEDLRIWMWEITSLGGGFWNCVFNGMHPGVTEDKRNADLSVPMYKFIDDNTDLICDMYPVHEAVILYSESSKTQAGNDDLNKDGYAAEIRGFVSCLTDNHIQYGFVDDRSLSIENLKDAQVLILPNDVCLSDSQIETIRDYVASGGNLIASYNTSLYDIDSSGAVFQRKDFALSDMFGVTFERNEESIYDCYQWVNEPDSPVLTGITSTTLLPINWNTAVVKAVGCSAPALFVPIVKNQPPEQAWRTVYKSDNPSIAVNSYGKGKVVYFASQIGKCVYTDGHDDFRDLLGNVFSMLIGERAVNTDAPESVHVNMIKKENDSCVDIILSLINETSAVKRPIRSLVPVRNINLEIPVMKGEISVKPLYGSVSFESAGKALHLHLDELTDFCSVWIQIKKL